MSTFSKICLLQGVTGPVKNPKNAFLNDPKSQKKRVLAIFWSFVYWNESTLHILIVLNTRNNLATISLMLDHSKIKKMHFWMIQRAKIEVLGPFLEFGLLYRLYIAYCDDTKCFLTFGNVTKLWKITQKSKKCIFEWSKEPKQRFLAIFLS